MYSPSTTAALGIVEDAQPEEPLTLRGEGLWVCLISSGKCVVSLSDFELMPAGSALLLPPQNAAAGHLVLSRGPLTLAPENECHLLCVQLTGQAAEQFLAGLSEMPFLARGETCPAAERSPKCIGPAPMAIASFVRKTHPGPARLAKICENRPSVIEMSIVRRSSDPPPARPVTAIDPPGAAQGRSPGGI